MIPETKPNPDPTVATNDAVERAVQAERDYVDGQLDVLRERIHGIDRATELRSESIVNMGARIETGSGHLTTLFEAETARLDDLTSERFSSIQTQFKERDTRQERECLSADELVLCADLVWRAAGTLQVGDELIALDEEPQPGRKGRCYRRAVVTANSLKPDRLLSVNTLTVSVRCNAEHPWLVRDHTQARRWHWVRTCDLRPSMTVMNVLNVWETDRSYEAGWLAGMLDGEGWLGSTSRRDHGGSRIIIGQVLGALDDAIGLALEDLEIPVKRYSRAAIGNARAQSRWQVDSRPAIMRLLGSVRPQRLLTKADAVWEGRALFGKSRPNTATIVSITDAGMGTIAMLSTTTGTYIGAGFAHHNSRDNKVAVDAAFAAQKEAAAKQDEANAKAIDKSEKATAETIKTNQELSKSTTDALTKSLDEVKLAVASIESVKRGSKENTTAIYAFVGFLVALLTVVALLAAFYHK